MQAITRSLPPQFGQVSMSMTKTRLRRCIKLKGATALSRSTCSATVAAVMPDAKNQNDESLHKVQRISYSQGMMNRIG